MRQAPALRRYPFESITNFRDLGGYPAQGGMTRWGVFFRSARLSRATQADLDALRAMGIRSTFDLRMDIEAQRRPDPIEGEAAFGYRRISLMGSPDIDMKAIAENPDLIPPMSTLYEMALRQNPGAFAAMITQMAERVALGPILFHCTAGKDRTGLTAMLLLSICGVSRLDILADYQVSRTYNSEDMPEDTTGSDPAHLLKAMQMLEREYGGPVEYLLRAGVTRAAIDTLRGALTQPL